MLKSRLKEQENLLFVNQNKIKDNKLPVVVLVEGWGTAGKGTLIGNVINNIDPRFYKVATFDMPTDLEKRKPFLCRYFEALPEAGKAPFYAKMPLLPLWPKWDLLCRPIRPRSVLSINSFPVSGPVMI